VNSLTFRGQSNLPEFEPNKKPQFTHTKVAKVTGNKDFDTKGVLYARFTMGGSPCPVYVYEGGVNVKPEEGDMISVGYLESDKTTPYFAGFAMDAYACARFIKIHKDGIALQLPMDDQDRKDHMSDDANVEKRVYVRLFKDNAVVSVPDGTGGTNKIKVTKTNAEIDIGTTKVNVDKDSVDLTVGGTVVTIKDGVLTVTGVTTVNLGGTSPVARQGDTVTVSVPTIGTCTGTITSGSSKVTAG
jgi:hypothetical protein